MSHASDRVDPAVESLGGILVELLAAQGWTRRDLGGLSLTTATRRNADGVLVVAELLQTSFSWPQRWPVQIRVTVGVGYEPALNLLPLLALPADPLLLLDDRAGEAAGFPVSLTGPADVAPAAHRIADRILSQAADLAARYPTAEAIDAELERRTSAAAPSSDDDSPEAAPELQDRLVLLAALNRHEQVRTLLAGYEAGVPAESEDARFARQLTRWLDRGGPPAPPVEETLALLPPRQRPSLPSHAATTAKAKANREALAAARAQSRGKNLEELKTLVQTEHHAHGIELAPSTVALIAEMLQLEQRPFGRLRYGVRAVRMLATASRDTVALFRGQSEDEPDWLRPPDRASYPVRTDRDKHVAVELDAAAQDWLIQAQAQAPRHIGPWTLLSVWLTRDGPTGDLVANLGNRRVGTVRQPDTHPFDRAMAAAALLDEDPLTDARLTISDGQALLEIAAPTAPSP